MHDVKSTKKWVLYAARPPDFLPSATAMETINSLALQRTMSERSATRSIFRYATEDSNIGERAPSRRELDLKSSNVLHVLEM